MAVQLSICSACHRSYLKKVGDKNTICPKHGRERSDKTFKKMTPKGGGKGK